MRVLLSIKPQFVERISSGSKKYEFRRKIFTRTDIQTCVIYSTRPVAQIVGEFDIKNIIKLPPDEMWQKTSSFAGISRSFFDEYFFGRNFAFALEIGDVRMYRQPISPADFCEKFTPPQSYAYISHRPSKSDKQPVQRELFEASCAQV